MLLLIYIKLILKRILKGICSLNHTKSNQSSGKEYTEWIELCHTARRGQKSKRKSDLRLKSD